MHRKSIGKWWLMMVNGGEWENYYNSLTWIESIKWDDSTNPNHHLWWGRSEAVIIHPDTFSIIYVDLIRRFTWARYSLVIQSRGISFLNFDDRFNVDGCAQWDSGWLTTVFYVARLDAAHVIWEFYSVHQMLIKYEWTCFFTSFASGCSFMSSQ